MPDTSDTAQLHRAIRRLQAFTTVLAVAMIALLAWLVLRDSRVVDTDEVRARRLVIVDDAGIKRIEIGQDAQDAGRRDRSAGMWIFDNTGNERGGMSTFDDGSVVIALDAPVGVGAQGVRDRAGLRVNADGSAQMLLTDNQTRGIVRLLSDGNGGGGVQTLRWDMPGKQINIRTTTFDGDERTQLPLGEPE
jgi:hypothetical protein